MFAPQLNKHDKKVRAQSVSQEKKQTKKNNCRAYLKNGVLEDSSTNASD